MFVQATITCECGCIFESEFQESNYENPPTCPQCGKQMNQTSWEALRNTMGKLSDFN